MLSICHYQYVVIYTIIISRMAHADSAYKKMLKISFNFWKY